MRMMCIMIPKTNTRSQVCTVRLDEKSYLLDGAVNSRNVRSRSDELTSGSLGGEKNYMSSLLLIFHLKGGLN